MPVEAFPVLQMHPTRAAIALGRGALNPTKAIGNASAIHGNDSMGNHHPYLNPCPA